MTVKKIEIEGLRNCPVCGSKPVLRRNASKRFQVHCTKCDACTGWKDKTEAIITWYNNAELYEKIHGKIQETRQQQEKPLSHRERITGEAVNNLVEALARYVAAEHDYHSSLDRLEDAKNKLKQ